MNRMMIIAVAFAAGCLGSAPKTTSPTDNTPAPAASTPLHPSSSAINDPGTDPGLGLAPPTTTGGTNNTFDHDNTTIDPFDVLNRIQETGAPEISTRMHSCQKLKYATLGNLLTQLGVDMNKQSTPPSAGQLYQGGAQALGAPNYGARVREAIEGTTAGDTKLFDIFSQAAPEIIAAMPNAAACMVAGQATQMFDAQGKCTQAGVSCLMGSQATQAQVDLCNQVLTEASSAQVGQAIAVATILSAAHTCE